VNEIPGKTSAHFSKFLTLYPKEFTDFGSDPHFFSSDVIHDKSPEKNIFKSTPKRQLSRAQTQKRINEAEQAVAPEFPGLQKPLYGASIKKPQRHATHTTINRHSILSNNPWICSQTHLMCPRGIGGLIL
jgi:hypothetical protein